MRRKIDLTIKGRIVFILRCADGSYFSGMCEDLRKKIKELKDTYYFKYNPERFPVTVVFKEDHLPFVEAYVKHRYLKTLTRRHRERLIQTKKWPCGKMLKNFVASKPPR